MQPTCGTSRKMRCAAQNVVSLLSTTRPHLLKTQNHNLVNAYFLSEFVGAGRPTEWLLGPYPKHERGSLLHSPPMSCGTIQRAAFVGRNRALFMSPRPETRDLSMAILNLQIFEPQRYGFILQAFALKRKLVGSACDARPKA